MNNGLGHFLIVSFNQPSINWQEDVLGCKQAIKNVSLREENIIDISAEIKAIAYGDVKFSKLESAETSELCLSAVFGKTSIEEFIRNGTEGFYGKFALVKINHQSGDIKAYTDATRQINLYWLSFNGINAVSTDIRLFSYIPGYSPEINPESIYHHLNFAYIPTPFSIYKNINKLGAGTELTITNGKGSLRRYWMPVYQEDMFESEETLVERLNDEIVNTIQQYSTSNDNWGCFLSGGTDSSTITGVTSRKVGGANTHGYSIGFDEKGYDELEYAEIAAKAFNINHHARRIGKEETLSAIDILIESYDEPFGNSSAIPTYYCALLAKEYGHSILIGGDGGDEIFGGNERYAKDYYFNLFYSLPSPVKNIASLVNSLLKPVDTRFINRINNYIYRASLPNPERFYTDDSFGSEYFDTLLGAELKSKISKDSALQILHNHYDQCQAHSELNKLMYIDLQMAIADNDLTKVNRAAAAADVSVMYPYLSPDLINFMGHIPSQYKVKKTNKRYLFKKAVSDILPIEIQKKKKQGFGLPVGEWFRHDVKYKELLNDTLLSQRSVERGYFNKLFIQDLINKHEKGTWDYTSELWLLLILELWHQEYVDA